MTSIVAALLIAGSTAAITPTASATTTPAGSVSPAVSSLSFVEPPANCYNSWTYGGGRFVCSSRVMRVQWGNGGNLEWFGIGTDNHVYHIVYGWKSWVSMGGSATDVYNAFDNGTPPTVAVFNGYAHDKEWCSSWKNGGWTAWFDCT